MTHKLNRLTAMLLAVIMAFSVLLVPVSAAGFADVSSSAWYKSAVDYVSERGWMAGIGDDKFAPNMEVTRATFVTVLARYAGADVKNETTIFQDVPADKWYTGAVTWAAQNGIVEGIGDNCFAPGRSITRQDLCAILYRYMDQQGIVIPADADVTCADRASVSGYALPAVDFFYASGLVSGFEDGSFRPKDTATRAQIASILMRFDKAVKANTAKPEQSFDSEAGEGMSVTVNAPVGALPEGTEMNVSRVTDEAALAAIQAKVSGNVLAAADISFNKNGEELEPETDVEVVINLEGIKDVQNPMIAHIKDDGTVEYVSAEMVSLNRGSSRALRFYARDFSVYVVTTDPSATYTVTVNFYVRKNSAQGASSNLNDWELISKQVVRGNQIQDATETTTLIHDPGVPDLNEDQAFEGWTTNRGFTEETEGVTVEDINATVRGLTGETELNYYSMVYDVVYVVYHDQAGAIIRTQYEHKDPDTGKATIIMDGYTPFKGEQNCTGWVLRDSVTSLGDHPTYVNNPSPLYQKNSPQEIEDVLEVYPYVQEGYWLSFNNNIAGNSTANGFQDDSHAEYISPVFYAKGVNTVAPSFPTNNPRPGYTFAGWYTDPAMRNAYSFGAPITADTTLYAKWTPATSQVRVVIWTQNAKDSVSATNANKKYDFYASYVVSNQTTGSTFTVPSGATSLVTSNLSYNGSVVAQKLGQFFTYNSTNTQQSVVVTGDGLTTLNVYYDRKVVTINFYSTTSTSAPYGSYNYKYGHYYADSNLLYERQGLYGAPLDNWPPAGSGYRWYWYFSSSDYYLMSLDNWNSYRAFDSDNTGDTEWYLHRQSYSGSSEKTVHWIGQNTEGSYSTALATSKLASGNSTLFDDTLFLGFTLLGWNTRYAQTSGSYWNSRPSSGQGTLNYSSIYNNDAYIFYDRNKWDFLFNSNGETYYLNSTSGGYQGNGSKVYYGKKLSELSGVSSHVPTNGPEGYYFDGWYKDPSYKEAFDFDSTMPNNAVTVYAKWSPKKYRIVVDYKRGDNSIVVTVPGTTQQASFKVTYGDQIQTSALLSAKREGYILLGLYTDPACEHLFNENMQAPFGLVSEAQEVYPVAERTGVDQLTGAAWSDVGQTNVRAKITLYAKWRKDPQGTTGLSLTYLGDNDPDTGYFNTAGRPHVWDDPELYVDMADAYAQPASVPETEGEQFLHWQILTPDLDENGNYQYNADGSVKMKPSGDIAYPGQTFQPELDDAVQVKTRLPDPNCAHTARTQHEATEPTCTTPGNNEYWQCNGCGKIFATENGTEEYAGYEIPALGHLWGEATYSWDKSSEPYKCTATVYCERNNLHRLRETVTAELVEYDPAALNKPGKAHYVATFTNKPTFEDQTDTDVITTPALTGYVVTFSVPSGTMAPAQQVLEDGESADLSVTPTGTVDGWTFVGWVANPINNQTTMETTPLESYTPTGDKTLYALYTRNVAHGGTYTRVNSTQSNWAGNYVITYLNTSSLYALKGLTGTKSYEDFAYGGSIPLANTGMTRSSNGSTLTNVPERFVFTFEKDGSYYSIKNLETGSYLSRYASSSTALLRAYASYNATFGQWTPAYSSGNVTLTNNYSSSLYTGFTMLGFKTDGPYFWVNSSGQSDTENIYLWKETVAPGETAYYITNATAISAYDVSFSVPEGVTAPATQTVSAGGSIVLPEAGNPDNTHRFLGWSPVTVSDTGTLPGTWYAAGALYTPSDDVTLVALYMSYDEYFTLLTTKPSTMSGTYVISSGTTTGDYMMLSLNTGNYQSASYKTLISDTAIAITTENGNKVMRNVPNTNRFTISDITTSGYTTYKAIRNNDGYYINVNSSGYLAPIGTSLNTSTLWTITCTSGKFAFQSYTYSDYYMRYSGSYFLASTTTTPNLYLWKRNADAHYATLSEGGSGGSTTTQYTVTYHTNGTTNTVSVASGSSITLPTPSGVGNASFVGWVTRTVNNEPTQPTLVSSPYTVTGNVDLYALYSYSTAGTEETVYQLLTSLPTNDGSGYVITYLKTSGAYVLKGLSSAGSYETTNCCKTLSAAGITLDGTTLHNVADEYVFYVGKTTDSGYEDYIYLENKSTGGFVSMYESSETIWNYTSLYENGLWYPTYSSTNGNVTLKNYYYRNSTDYPYFSFSTDNSYFWSGSENGTNTSKIYFWKENTITTGSTTYYTTTVSEGTTTEYTITYHTNGATSTQDVIAGNSITLLPGSPIGDATFVGWVTGEVAATTTQPSVLTGSYTPTGNVDLYALYNNPVKTYELASSLTNGDKYILVDNSTISGGSGYAVGNSVVANNRYLNAVSVSISNDAVTASNVASILWQVASSGSGYTFYNAAAGKYIGLDSSEYVYPSSTALAWAYTSDGYLDNQVDSGSYYYLGFDSTNTRYTTNKAGHVINPYKETTTNYYTTSVSTGTTSVELPEGALERADWNVEAADKLTGALDIQALGLPETVFEQPAAETVGDGSPVPETKANVPQPVETETAATVGDGSPVPETAATSAPQVDLTRQGDIAQTASTVPTVPVTDGPTDPNGSSSVEYGEPVDAITDGETYFIGYHHRKDTDNDGVYDIDKVYLLMNHNPAANAYYTSASLSGYTCTKVCYAIPAILDENGKVIGVDTTNCAGATLDDVKWKFNLSTTDTDGARYNIQSVNDDGYYLRIEDDSSSSSTDLQLYPGTSVSRYYKNYWRWDSTNHYLSHYYGSGYSNLRKYISVLTSTSTGEVTCFEADSDSTYAKYINLYQYTEKATYTLTVLCKDADGNVLATKTFENVPAGAYTIDGAAIAVSGYQRTSPDSALSITMPASDYSVDIVFAPNVVSNERWEPTDTIVEGEDYLIAYVVNGTPYLLLNHSDVNNADYYTITSGSDTYNLGYLGQASTVTENGKTYVSGVSGPTTDLSNCHWRFVSVTGGYNIVVPETPTKGLYWGGSTSGIAGVVPNNSLDTWVWTATDNTNHYGTMKNSWTSAGGTSYTMYFYPRTSTGTASTTANPPYAGVSSSSFARIRLYHKAKELSTWNVSFVDQDGNALEGYPDQAVPNGQLLETPAAYQNEDYYFLGWFNEDGTPFDFNQPITADTIVVAHLQYAWEVKYTVYLQAVYGMVNKDGTTHIYWYTNDGTDRGVGVGAGYRQETLGLRINAATDIPTPTSYTYTDENGTTQTGLYRPGYTFLGWAREETVGAGNMGVDKTDLTEADLYIWWNNNCYWYNAGTAENPDWQQLTGGASSQGQVYADESRPYHDMYAVWAPAYYYVFHSSSGKLEQKNLEFTAATETQASMIKATDLTASVTPGYLYGGYYKTYGGVDMTAVNAKIKALEMGTTTWPDGVYNTGASESFVAYTGASAKNGTQKFWTRADAYQITGSMSSTQIADVKAETMRPVAGSVYYLKEVPDTYLANKFYYVYDNFNDLVDEEGNLIDEEGNLIPEGGNPVKTKLLQNLYFLSVIDDTNYTTIGYKVIDLVDEAEADDSMAETLFEGITKRTAIAKSVNFVQQNADVSDPENPTDLTTTVRPTDFTGIQGGYVEMLQLDNFISANNAFTVRPTWETLDGVQVSSKTGLGITIPSDCKYHETGEESFNDGGRGRVLYTANRLYIDLEHAKFKYTNNNGASFTDENWAYNRNDNKTVAYFFNDSGNTWVELQTSADYMKYVDVPDGYNKMILVMFGKDETNYRWTKWENGKEVPAFWAQTANITIHTNKNCISSFYGYSSNSYVQKPTTDNFTVWANFAPDLDEEE